MNTIIIRIPEISYDLTTNSNIQWCITGNNQAGNQVVNTGNIEEFSNYYQSLLAGKKSSNCTVVLALPSTMVLYKKIKTNKKHRKYLSSTLPYLIEEYLSVNIEEMHIQYSQLNNESDYIRVCAIQNNLIQTIIDLFNKYVIPLDSIIAEAELFHSADNSISLFLDKSLAILVNQEDQGIVVNNDKIIHYFASVGSVQADLNADTITKVNFCYTSAATKKDITLITNSINNSGLSVDITPLDNTIINYINNSYHEAMKNNGVVDLRQGIYACKRKIGRMINRWKPIAIALSCCLIIDILVSTGLGFAYSQKQNNLWKINMEKYIEMFPKDQQAIRALQKKNYKFDVQKMLKNKMKNFDQSASDNTFLFVWQSISNLLDESKLQVALKKIDYTAEGKKIKLEFNSDDTQEINKLKNAIISKYNFDVQEYIKDGAKYLLVGKKA